MKNQKLFLASVALMASVIATDAMAGSCRNAIRAASAQIFGSVLNEHCVDLNMQPGENSSQFVYTNPDAGCDLGLSLPGLPGFGIGFDGNFDMCGLAKMVTGGMVREFNQQTQGAMNTAIGAINQQGQSTIGTNVIGTDMDVGDIVMDQLKQSGATPTFAP